MVPGWIRKNMGLLKQIFTDEELKEAGFIESEND